MLSLLKTVSPARSCFYAGLSLAPVLVWVYWGTLVDLAGRWGSQAQYSHGYIVPFFSAYLLWSRWHIHNDRAPQPSWWGLPLLGVALCLRFAGTYIYFDWLMAASVLPCLGSVCLLVGGGRCLLAAWPALAFLLFMIPLPFSLEAALSHPLQRIGTLVSTSALQTLGFAAYAEGNVIVMGGLRIGVVEACSGLSMLMIFFALSTAITMLVRRPPFERLTIFLSAVPIALAANSIRIIATAVLHKTAGPQLADLVFHDLAGWLMMPLGLAMLWALLCLLDWVLVPSCSHERQRRRRSRAWQPVEKTAPVSAFALATKGITP
jgi:exosortase